MSRLLVRAFVSFWGCYRQQTYLLSLSYVANQGKIIISLKIGGCSDSHQLTVWYASNLYMNRSRVQFVIVKHIKWPLFRTIQRFFFTMGRQTPQQLLPLISTVTTATTSKSGSREPDLFSSLLFLKQNT